MTKVYIHANDMKISMDNKQRLKELLLAEDYQIVSETEHPDIVVSVGGDGTLLSAFHLFSTQLDNVIFMGIHTGHLGFYTDWQIDELSDSIEAIRRASDDNIDYPVIQLKAYLKDGQIKEILALNEVSIRSNTGTMVCDVAIGHQLFETFRGDGVCVASPTGSTGLNKSLGGAVIYPSLETLQMTEMAAVNNRVYRTLGSPIIIPGHEQIELKPLETGKQLVLMVDNSNYVDLQIEKLEITMSSHRIRFAGYKHTDFWSRVGNSFIG